MRKVLLLIDYQKGFKSDCSKATIPAIERTVRTITSRKHHDLHSRLVIMNRNFGKVTLIKSEEV